MLEIAPSINCAPYQDAWRLTVSYDNSVPQVKLGIAKASRTGQSSLYLDWVRCCYFYNRFFSRELAECFN